MLQKTFEFVNIKNYFPYFRHFTPKASRTEGGFVKRQREEGKGKKPVPTYAPPPFKFTLLNPSL